ncbi:hypothetical protein [Streptomyces lannensis]|uniref:hypothetical protein n=1 Tax=Streptomyces lannensis TaxID=766498 RepID=UPI0031F1227C
MLGRAYALRAGKQVASGESTDPDQSGGGAADAAKAQPNTVVMVRPAQLPVALRAFTGRRHELAHVEKLLPALEGPVSTVVIGGMAGVGKTTLAVHWAHMVANRFPDGQLYVNLRSSGAVEQSW